MSKDGLLWKTVVRKKIEISLLSVFVGHGYVQHVERESRGSHCARYHTYLISDNRDLPDAIAIANKDSIHAGPRSDALSARKAASSGEADVDVKSS